MTAAVSLVLLAIAGRSAVAQESATAPGACPVKIIAEGVRGSQGTIGFVVYSSKDGWPDDYEKAFARKAVPARPGNISVEMRVRPGRYAIALLHDENGNKRMDRKPSRRPREGYGLSKDPKVYLKTPSFKSAAIDLACGYQVPIRLHYPSKKDDDEDKDSTKN